MATVCKLYCETPLVIPPSTWTLVTFDSVLRNDHSMAQGLSLITPPQDGDFIWARNLRWEALTIPAGDTRPRQFMSRIIRDPHGIRDDTGADDRVATPGRSWQTVAWPFKGKAGQPVGVEVWHDHHTNATLGHAQFAAQTNDY
jgi:hypothetical protein